MDISPDEKRILEALRASLASRARIPRSESAPAASDNSPDFATLANCFDIYKLPLDSQKAWSGSPRVILRRILWTVLAGFFQPQAQHNATVTHALRAVWAKMTPWDEKFWAASDQIDQLRKTVRKEAEELQELRLETRQLRCELQELRQARARSANEES